VDRRSFITGFTALFAAGRLHASATLSNGERLAAAARAQVSVTTGYDPTYSRIPYPNGDVPRTTGVCADVVIRAGRDGLALDLQKLIHEDMLRNFAAYPARQVWGAHQPDANIDHRRVVNLQAYFARANASLWSSRNATPGDGFPAAMQTGDILSWLLDARQPHIGIIVAPDPQLVQVVHNIGNGAELTPLTAFHPHRAAGHFRWPAVST
jgi:uncharacterized protein